MDRRSAGEMEIPHTKLLTLLMFFGFTRRYPAPGWLDG
jgi:hypothetical protein